ncbi:hypothetical protein GGS20DRAFT_379610 [Poronia punctata]|nr:hypothetical protein GGS20DRAFT_379610 [Poronia punctata]
MHHSRRKSGHGSTNSSMTDVRKAGNTTESTRPRRPQTLTRKSTPQTLQKLGKSSRTREREWEQGQWSDDETETFPQFCMTCEKQFIVQDERVLYCSEACRKHDQTLAASYAPVSMYGGYGSGNLPFYGAENQEPRDIIPRASPSRPNSNYFSPPATPTNNQYPKSVSALRSLSRRPPSPPSPASMNASGIWPFTRSAATSPSSSYSTPSNVYSSTYDGAYTTSAYHHSASGGVMTSDRPLPTRNPPAYSKPKSIELVTPVLGHY